MSSQRRRKLDALVAQLQVQHGQRAIRRAEPGERTPAVARISTTFIELDAMLDGGLPRGRISEVIGPATSGKVTLAAKVIAAAHRERETVAAWIDPSRTCDPDYMHRCGIDLSRLLIVRPATLADTLAISLHLAQTDTLAVLVMDTLPLPEPGEPPGSSESAIAGTLARLATLLVDTQAVALFLTEPERSSQALAHAAAVRVSIRREKWITRNGDVRGYEAQAALLKNRLGRAGAVANIRIIFNGTVRGDGL